ncbi:MAG: hypothetical protein II998_05740 [Clostridia bacterium]|nr:hypothetical protein [Clostridia bacterium]
MNCFTKEKIVEIADRITEIELLLEKIDVLTDDIYLSFFDRFEVNRNALFTDNEINSARIKADIVRKFVVPALEKTKELRELI